MRRAVKETTGSHAAASMQRANPRRTRLYKSKKGLSEEKDFTDEDNMDSDKTEDIHGHQEGKELKIIQFCGARHADFQCSKAGVLRAMRPLKCHLFCHINEHN